MNIYEYAELLIRQERERHPGLGWDAEHDEGHAEELARAASSYTYHVAYPDAPPLNWPWDIKYWKPRSPREDYIRAGALYLAAEDAEIYQTHKLSQHRRFEATVRLLAHEVLGRMDTEELFHEMLASR